MVGNAFTQTLPTPRLVQTTNGCSTYTYRNITNLTFEFSGSCVNGLVNGKGVTKLYSNNNLVYTLDGEFKDGYPTGKGTLVATNGDTYLGEFKEGLYSGRGIFTSSNGNKYVGEWKEGLKSGLGVDYLANGTVVQSGRWTNGSLTQSFTFDLNRLPFSESNNTAVVSERERSDTPDFNQVPNRIESYILEAQRLKNEQKYFEACNFLDTAIKLININGLENRFGVVQITTQKNQICELRRLKSEKELKDAVNKLNALMNGPDGKPNIFYQEMIGCRAIREECLRTSNFNSCIAIRAPSCRQ